MQYSPHPTFSFTAYIDRLRIVLASMTTVRVYATVSARGQQVLVYPFIPWYLLYLGIPYGSSTQRLTEITAMQGILG